MRLYRVKDRSRKISVTKFIVNPYPKPTQVRR